MNHRVKLLLCTALTTALISSFVAGYMVPMAMAQSPSQTPTASTRNSSSENITPVTETELEAIQARELVLVKLMEESQSYLRQVARKNPWLAIPQGMDVARYPIVPRRLTQKEVDALDLMVVRAVEPRLAHVWNKEVSGFMLEYTPSFTDVLCEVEGRECPYFAFTGQRIKEFAPQLPYPPIQR
jgi:hypothetical protein